MSKDHSCDDTSLNLTPGPKPTCINWGLTFSFVFRIKNQNFGIDFKQTFHLTVSHFILYIFGSCVNFLMDCLKIKGTMHWSNHLEMLSVLLFIISLYSTQIQLGLLITLSGCLCKCKLINLKDVCYNVTDPWGIILNIIDLCPSSAKLTWLSVN